TAWTNAVGPQRRSRRRNHVEEGKQSPEISSAPDSRSREAADPESLPRQFQARSATILPHRCGITSGKFSCHRRKLSNVRTANCLILVANYKIAKNSAGKFAFSLAQNSKLWHLQTSSHERTPKFVRIYAQIAKRAVSADNAP